jgi:hypothetical protein
MTSDRSATADPQVASRVRHDIHPQDRGSTLGIVEPGERAREDAITDLYRGPLETFVSRRDALARDLRTAGEREGAAAIKVLKKPSRAAWALNLAVLRRAETMDALVTAIKGSLAAQASGGDVRASIGGIRAAVREFAALSSQAAGAAGQDVDPGDLAVALSAVLGTTESFEELRRGRLTEVPEAGGLDLLSSLPALATGQSPRPAPESLGTKEATDPARPEQAEAQDTVERERAAKAASDLKAAQARAAHARETLREAEDRLGAAEARVRDAEEEAHKARTQRDRARKEADAAGTAVEAARAALEDTRRKAGT